MVTVPIEPEIPRLLFELRLKVTEFADAIGALKACVRIRNQYAHCAWADGGKGRNGGLYFVDLSTSAEAATGWDSLSNTTAAGRIRYQPPPCPPEGEGNIAR